jgi:hypothetical protein
MPAGNDNAITVSYGSFSVTLSGHENPFEMLKQITDYYSILAETNPNFGAVPTAAPADLMVETVSAPQPKQTSQPSETTAQKYILESETTDNLWQDPVPKYQETPLVLQEPVTPDQVAADVLVASADQALSASELPLESNAEATRPQSKFLTSNYPFRHFPLRRPGRG